MAQKAERVIPHGSMIRSVYEPLLSHSHPEVVIVEDAQRIRRKARFS